jgi:hypothetical protein
MKVHSQNRDSTQPISFAFSFYSWSGFDPSHYHHHYSDGYLNYLTSSFAKTKIYLMKDDYEQHPTSCAFPDDLDLMTTYFD